MTSLKSSIEIMQFLSSRRSTSQKLPYMYLNISIKLGLIKLTRVYHTESCQTYTPLNPHSKYHLPFPVLYEKINFPKNTTSLKTAIYAFCDQTLQKQIAEVTLKGDVQEIIGLMLNFR